MTVGRQRNEVVAIVADETAPAIALNSKADLLDAITECKALSEPLRIKPAVFLLTLEAFSKESLELSHFAAQEGNSRAGHRLIETRATRARAGCADLPKFPVPRQRQKLEFTWLLRRPIGNQHVARCRLGNTLPIASDEMRPRDQSVCMHHIRLLIQLYAAAVSAACTGTSRGSCASAGTLSRTFRPGAPAVAATAP
jgi:hypothetical protein